MDELTGFPLSRPQRGLWRRLSTQPASCRIAWRVADHITASDLREAVEQVILDHEALRTTFQSVPGMAWPLQIIHDEPLLHWEEVDSQSGLTLALLLENAVSEGNKLSLEQGPVVQAVCLEIDEGRHLLFQAPLMCLDTRGCDLITRDLSARLLGEAPEYEEDDEDAPMQYVDFSEWQEELSEDQEALRAGRQFWDNVLSDAVPSPRPPACRAVETAVPNRRVQTQFKGPQLNRDLIAAAVTALLARFTGDTRLTLNLMSNARVHESFEETVGAFDVPVPLTLDCSPATSFAKLQEQVTWLSSRAGEQLEYRYWEDVEDQSPGMVLDYVAPLQPTSVLTPVHHHSDALHNGLRFYCQSTTDGLQLSLDYHENDLYPEDAQAMVDSLGHLLENIDPQATLASMSLLPDHARGPLLDTFNRTSDTAVGDRSLTALFVDQVRATPDADALHLPEGILSFAQLASWAARIQTNLTLEGIQPGDRVGLLVEPGAHMIPAVLGILGCGAAYVAMDPLYPGDRLNYIISDSRAKLTLTQADLAEQLQPNRTLLLESHPDPDAEIRTFQPVTEPGLPAYLLYTSGSTGRPKGVIITHATLTNYLQWAARTYMDGGGLETPVHSSIGFDLTTTSLYAPLLAGKAVAFGRTEGVEGLQEILGDVRPQSMIKLTPSHLKALNAVLARQDRIAAVDCLVIGGEMLTGADLEPWRTLSPHTRFINEYGPTEATVGCSIHTVSPSDGSGSIDIGKPIANVNLYVVDANGRPLPRGVLGELLIGGACLAQGYNHRPDLTAERFRPDPFSQTPGARVYHSGDLVRFGGSDETRLVFHGRNDDQLKIRGFRIEPGEIEAALLQYPNIREAVVGVQIKENVPRLIGYIAGPEAPDLDQLQIFLEQRLPFYMVPPVFVHLDTLPLTTHGKVDDAALPDPDQKDARLSGRFVAPRNEVEQAMADSWRTTLGVEKVGIHDNYFTLGGDSIRSVQTVAEMQSRGLDLVLRDLFEKRTIAALAELLESRACGDISAAHTDETHRGEPFSQLSQADRDRLPEGLEDAYPLGSVQLGMLLHMNRGGEEDAPPAYHNVATYRMKIPVDGDLFQKAVDLVVARLPVLRTCFDLNSYSEPLQLVYKQAKLDIIRVDLTHLDEEAGQKAVQDFIAAENFNLVPIDKPPLVRLHLHFHDKETVSFSITEPHSISDGWSTHLTLRDIFLTYIALVRGEEPPPHVEPEVTYGDFIRLEREAVASPDVQTFWRRKLDLWTHSELPVIHPAYREQSGLYDHKIYNYVPDELLDGMRKLADIAGVPLKAVLLTSHLKALSLLTGQPIVTTGLVFNGRPEAAGGEDIRGLFLNTLPFPFQLENGSWLDLVRAVYQAEIEMIPNRRYPLGVLQAQHGPQKLFEAAFTFHHFHSIDDVIDADWFEPVSSTDLSRTNFDLTCAYTIQPLRNNSLTLMMECEPQRIAKDQLVGFYAYYEEVFKAMAAAADNPDLPHHGVNLLPQQERTRLVEALNQTQTDMPPFAGVHQLIARHAQMTPDAPAVFFEGQTLTYAQLMQQADRVAALLTDGGVRSEEPVALLMERGLMLMPVLIGILKAGAVFLPLDPEHPLSRRNTICRDAQVRFIFTDQADAQAETHTTLFHVDQLPQPKHAAPNYSVHPEQAAYLIYTSGSTGTPKGVLNSHGALFNVLQWMGDMLDMGPGRSVMQKCPLTFDVSIWELFQPLVRGSRLVVVKPEGHRDSRYLSELLVDEDITDMHFVPSMLALFLEDPQLPAAPHLKHVVCIGEALPETLVARFYQHFPQATLWNSYGPAEAAIVVTNHPCPRENMRFMELGKPEANNQLYVLGRDLFPLPACASGELAIGGDQLARGYFNRPDLTAQSFVPDPFSNIPGSRIYRTGDAVRFMPDGALMFLGRLDFQIKLRGHRIEIGEIEACLLAHEGVSEAVVILREDVPGQPNLCAYVVRRESQSPVIELRNHLGAHLPAYMVPAAFAPLEAMPLNTSGKADRRALARMAAPDTLEQGGDDMLTPIQQQVAQIWTDILGRTPRTDSDFFDLGGQSLLAIRALYRLREAFDVDMNIQDFFLNATLETQCQWLEEALRTNAGIQRPPITAQPDRREAPASFAQKRVWLAQQANPEGVAFNMFFALQLKGDHDTEKLAQAVTDLTRRHAGLRTTFSFADGDITQHINEDVHQPRLLDLGDQSAEAVEQQLTRLSEEMSQRPFKLDQGPLFEATVVRAGSDDVRLLCRLHHIITDAWSQTILFNELRLLYKARVTGESLTLAPPPVTYADYAAWQRNWLQGEALERTLSALRERLHGAPPVQPLPLAAARHPEAGFEGAVHAFQLDGDLAQGLHQLCRQHQVSLFMVLLSAWQTTLHCLTGETDVVLGTDVANRGDREIQGLIGFFVNQLVLRTDLSDDPTFEALLKRQRQATLAAFAHQDFPFDHLVEALNPERHEHIAPLFQRKIVLNNMPDSVERGEDDVRLLPLHRIAESKMDLQLNMSERADHIHCELNYKTALFESAAVTRLSQTFIQVAQLAVDQPLTPLSRFHKAVGEVADAKRREDVNKHRKGAKGFFKSGGKRRSKLTDD